MQENELVRANCSRSDTFEMKSTCAMELADAKDSHANHKHDVCHLHTRTK
jgi:hypothetical protein